MSEVFPRTIRINAADEGVLRSVLNVEILLRMVAHPDFDSLKKFDEDDWSVRAEWNKDYRGTLTHVLQGWAIDHAK